MNEGVDIEALKNDSEFLENVKKLEQEVQTSDSLAKIYQLLDVYLALQEDEAKINELFQKVVDKSFEVVAKKIEQGEELNLGDPDEWAAARGIYEHAIALFSENQTKSAQELFLALHHLINDFEVKDAMMVHAAAIGSGYSFDDFMNKLTKIDDSDFSDPKAVFITNFVQPVDILLEMMSDEVKKLNERLEKLKKAQEG
jgi:predicted GTPase